MPGRTTTKATGAGRSGPSSRSKPTKERPASAGSDTVEAPNDGPDSSLRKSICHLFYDAQKNLAGHRKLVVSLRKIQEECCYEPVSATAAGKKRGQDEFEETDFNAEFTRCIVRVLPIKKSEGAGDRIVRFMTSFLRFATEKDAELVPEGTGEDEVVETPTTRLTNEILSIVVPLLLAKDKFVRYRATQIIRHVVSSLDSIDDEVYHLLRSSLLKRIRDKEAMIRVQAVLGLTHLIGNDEDGEEDNESDDENQGLLEKLIDVLQNDSSADVRKTLLLNLPLTPVTLPFLLERARDVDPATRRALYSKLLPALGDFRHLSLSMREKLLRWGLRDRDDNVHDATAKLFRERWIEDIASAGISEEELKPGQAAPASIDALLELMERIDIVNSGVEEGIALQAFREFWEGRPDYIEALSFQDPFWENLTAESIFMVRSFNDFCRNDEKRWGETLEEKMPEVTKLAFMLEKYNNRLIKKLKEPFRTDEEVVEPEFIVEQLLHVTETLDYSDEIGRRKMYSLLRDMIAIPELPDEITKLSIGVLRNVCGSDSQGERDFCAVVLEAVADVHDTIADPADEMPEDPDDSFHSARSQQTDDLVPKTPSLRKVVRKPTDTAEDQARIIKEIMINMKCLHIAQCMLENIEGNLQANVYLVNVLNNLVVPAVRSHEAPIRERGLQCLGLCCLLDKNLAEENLTLFIHCFTKGHPALQVHALETLCDILCVHPGLVAPVSPSTPVPGATTASTEDSTLSPNLKPLLKAYTRALRTSSDADVLATSVTCLSKLYLTNTFADDGTLQQLVLTFFDPATLENHAARQALSYFLPAFSHSGRENMEAMARVAPDVVKNLVSMHDEFHDEEDGKDGIVGINSAVAMLADWTDTRRLVVVGEQGQQGQWSMLDDGNEKKPAVDGNVQLDLIAESLERAVARGIEKEYRRALLSMVSKISIIPESDHDKLEEVKTLVDDVVEGKLATETASKNALIKMQVAVMKALAAEPAEKKQAAQGAVPPTPAPRGKGRPKKSNEDGVVESIEEDGANGSRLDGEEDDDDDASTVRGADDQIVLDESMTEGLVNDDDSAMSLSGE